MFYLSKDNWIFLVVGKYQYGDTITDLNLGEKSLKKTSVDQYYHTF